MKKFVILLALMLVSLGAPVQGSPPKTPLSSEPSSLVNRSGIPADASEVLQQIVPDFEINAGQYDQRVRFLSRGPGFDLFLTRDAAVFALDGSDRPLQIRPTHGSVPTDVTGASPTAARSNILVGSDSSAWRRGIAHFERVVYASVYDGIDLVYYWNNGQLEFDFVVKPGADPSRIGLDIDGADRVSVDANGDAVFETSAGTLRQRAPLLHQMEDDVRTPVAGRFVRSGANSIALEVGAYDPSRTLTVDPVLTYSSYLGGSGNDQGRAVAIDTQGDLYVCGYTPSPNFPSLLDGGNAPLEDATKAFVSKLHFTGSADGPTLSLVFTTRFGGTTEDQGWAMVRDTSGNIFVTGFTKSTDFPLVNAYDTTYGGGLGGFDAFVAKLDSTGANLVYASYLSGTGDDYGTTIATDSQGAAYIGGYTVSSDFPILAALQPTLNARTAADLGASDCFVAKLDANGAGVFATYLGGSDADEAHGITVGAGGEACLTGKTLSADFPTVLPYQTDPGDGFDDVFVTRLNANGSGLVYSTYLAGAADELAEDIAVDSAGAVYVTGNTTSDDYPVMNPIATNMPGIDGFLTKLTFSGTALSLAYSTYFGGGGSDRGIAVAVDSAGTAFVTGYTSSPDFPTTGAFQLGRPRGGGPPFDGFVMRFASTGTSLLYSSYLGGDDGNEISHDIAVDEVGNAYVTGYTTATTFPTMTALQPANAGRFDGFVAKICEEADTVGISSASSFFLRNATAGGPADTLFQFGAEAGQLPIVGDWNGDGIDTIGLYVPATGVFFLKNTNGAGGADIVFTFGAGGSVPLVGDWNGDGVDTVGLYVPETGAFFLRNANASGGADIVFTFGGPGIGAQPVYGDWNADGTDSIGLYVSATGVFFLRDTNSPGAADRVLTYGGSGLGLVSCVGDWNGDRFDTVGLYDPSTGAFFLRNANTPGAADIVFTFGGPGQLPLSGNWNGR